MQSLSRVHELLKKWRGRGLPRTVPALEGLTFDSLFLDLAFRGAALGVCARN